MNGELWLRPSGSFRYLTDIGLQEIPVVGDWCAVSVVAADSTGLIEGVLPRRTVLNRAAVDSTRETAGSRLAAFANIHIVAIVMDIARDFKLRRQINPPQYADRPTGCQDRGGPGARRTGTARHHFTESPSPSRRRSVD
jgi:hypothetical protein